MKKRIILLVGVLFLAGLVGAETTKAEKALDGWTTSFNIFLHCDSLWGYPDSAISHAPIDYEGYPGGDPVDSTDSTVYGIYVRMWARKMSNTDPPVPESCAVNTNTSYSDTYYTAYQILPTGLYQIVASDGLSSDFPYYINIQTSLCNIKEIDGVSPFGFDDNDSLYVYVEDRYGNFSCYPERGSECKLLKFAWASNPGARWPDDYDHLGMYDPGIIDSLTWDVPNFWDVINSESPCELGVHEKPAVPEVPTLVGNTPNPFNAATDIEFILPQSDHVKLEVTDVLGKRVKLLCDKDMPEGHHKIRWDGTDDKGNEVPSGVYFYKLTVGKNFVDKRKMTLIK